MSATASLSAQASAVELARRELLADARACAGDRHAGRRAGSAMSAPESLDALWRDYLAARARAQASGDIAAGIAAGRAWGRWLKAFESAPPPRPDGAAADGCTVIPFQGRAS